MKETAIHSSELYQLQQRKDKPETGILLYLGNEVNWEIPSAHKWLLISDVEYDHFPDNVNWEELRAEMTLVIKCPVCPRAYVYHNGFSEEPEIYSREN